MMTQNQRETAEAVEKLLAKMRSQNFCAGLIPEIIVLHGCLKMRLDADDAERLAADRAASPAECHPDEPMPSAPTREAIETHMHAENVRILKAAKKI